MGHEMRLSKLLLLMGLLIPVSCLDFSRSHSVCNTESLDPNILDIIGTLVSDASVNKHLQKSSENVGFFSNFKLPIISFISNGEYRVQYENPSVRTFSFNDIYLIQENYASLNLVCDTFSGFLGPLNAYCGCGDGEPFDRTSNIVMPNHHSAHWCLKKPSCSDKSVAQGHCDFPVDPLRSSCVLLNIHSDSASKDSLNRLVTYKRTVPTLGHTWETLTSSTSLSALGISAFLDEQQISYLVKAGEVVGRVLSFLPRHLVLFLSGTYVVSNARDLAEQEPIQNVMIGLYGLLLAFIFLLYGLYRYILCLCMCTLHISFVLVQDQRPADEEVWGQLPADHAGPGAAVDGVAAVHQQAAAQHPARRAAQVLVRTAFMLYCSHGAD